MLTFYLLMAGRAPGAVPLVSDYDYLFRADFGLHADEAYPLGSDSLKPVFRHDEVTSDRHLRVDFTAGGKNEGVRIPLRIPQKNRLVKVILMMRGQGMVEVILRSPDGVAKHAQVVKLTGDWMWLEPRARVGENGEHFALELINQDPKAGDFLDVQRATVEVAEERQPRAIEVPARYYSAGYFTSRKGPPNKPVQSAEEFELRGMPFPRTSKPVTLYVACQSEGSGGKVAVLSRDRASNQVVAEKEIPPGSGQQWMAITGISASLVGADFVLQFTPASAKPLSVSRIVLSTDPNLDQAALAKATPILPPAPMAAVGRQVLPTDRSQWWQETLWKDAVEMGQFQRMDGEISLAPTMVRALHGDGHLYVRFDCEEPVLRVVEQRIHEFLDKETTADGAVDQDDFCLVMIRPSQASEETFRFWINANGTVRDARRTDGVDDVKWNGKAIGQARREDGRWSAIVAIPLSSLGMKSEEQTGGCDVAFGRKSVARNEFSSWNGSSSSWDESPNWGTLGFTKKAVPLEVVPPARLQVGDNLIEVREVGADELIGHIRLDDSEGAALRENFVFDQETLKARGGLKINLAPSLAEKKVRSAVAFLGADLAPQLIPRPASYQVEMPFVILTLQQVGAWQLLINGKDFQQGDTASGLAELSVPLQKGVNQLTLRVENSKGSAEINGEGFGGKRLRWVRAESAGKPETEWRTTLLWQESRVWPEPPFYFAENAVQQVPVVVDGAHHGAAGWNLYFAVPKDFEFVTASGFYAESDQRQPRFAGKVVGEEEIGGKRWQIVQVSADRRIPAEGEVVLHDRAAAVWTMFRAKPGASQTESQEMLYWTEAEDGAVMEARRSLPVRVLPPLTGRQPKTIAWQMWGPFEQFDDPKASAAILETAKQAGATDFDIGAAPSATGWVGKTDGLRSTLRIHFLNGSLAFGSYLTGRPDQRLVKLGNIADDSRVCTSALLEEAWPETERQLREQLEKFHPECVVYDYEYSPLGDGIMHSCYCPRCLEAFRSHAKLPASAALTGESINRDYVPQWVDYMAWQSARIFRKLKDSIHQMAPGTIFEVYSGYQTPDNPITYGVDWRYVGDMQAVDRATMGYGRPLEAIQATREALKGIPMLFGEIIYPFMVKDAIPSRPTTAAAQLRRVIDSAGGVLVYELGGMDARSWSAIAETSRLVAEFEEVFLKGTREVVSGVEEANGAILTGTGVTLYCLMNESPQAKEFVFSVPDRLGKGVEFYTGETLGGEIRLSVPGGQSRVIVFR